MECSERVPNPAAVLLRARARRSLPRTQYHLQDQVYYTPRGLAVGTSAVLVRVHRPHTRGRTSSPRGRLAACTAASGVQELYHAYTSWYRYILLVARIRAVRVATRIFIHEFRDPACCGGVERANSTARGLLFSAAVCRSRSPCRRHGDTGPCSCCRWYCSVPWGACYKPQYKPTTWMSLGSHPLSRSCSISTHYLVVSSLSSFGRTILLKGPQAADAGLKARIANMLHSGSAFGRLWIDSWGDDRSGAHGAP